MSTVPLQNNTPLQNGFYITGGTLSASASSYVTRQADTDLFAALSAGEFCYVLNSRQMGKSSLMVRTAEKLKAEGVTVAVLDLTAIGQNLSPEQWYDGLLLSLSQQLRLEDELEDFWLQNPQLGPLQRFFESLKQIVLPTLTRLVVFVDEIDVVRSLPFSADEFFAAIRQCYIGRATDANLTRLAFCLLGTATPADLIQDTRTSPFNIGTRIEVRDFTPAEARPLTQGLGSRGDRLLARVLYWTNGHPYLTQRLCRAVSEIQNPKSKIQNRDVDRLCTELFLTHKAKESDDNLMFVRNRLLKSEADLAALLDLYRQMRAGRSVPDDETNPLTSVLKLSGVARVEDGTLAVRNRIYRQVFDKAWVAAHLPDAEKRRQKAAYRQGVLRTTLLGLIVMSVFFFLVAVGFHARTRYVEAVNSALKTADINAYMEHRRAEEANDNLYFANINLMQIAYEAHNFRKINETLETTRNYPKRGLEWDYWNRLAHREWLKIEAAGSPFIFSPDSKRFFTQDDRPNSGSDSGPGIIWDTATGQKLVELKGEANFWAAAFAPDGKTVVIGHNGEALYFYDALTGQKIREVPAEATRPGVFWLMQYLPDGKRLFAFRQEGECNLVEAATGKERTIASVDKGGVDQFSLSSDGKRLYTLQPTGKNKNRIDIHELDTGKTRSVKIMGPSLRSIVLTPDGSHFALGSEGGKLALYDAKTFQSVRTFRGQTDDVLRMAWSADGKRLAGMESDYTVRVWNAETGEALRVIHGFTAYIVNVRLTPDGKRLFVATGDRMTRAWNVDEEDDTLDFSFIDGLHGYTNTRCLCLSPDGKQFLYAGQKNLVYVCDAKTGKIVFTLRGHTRNVERAVWSPDGATLATLETVPGRDNQGQQKIILWDVATRQRRHTFTPHNEDSFVDLAFAPDGKTLYTVNRDAGLKFWNVATGEKIRDFKPAGIQSHWSFRLAISPNGRQIALCGVNNRHFYLLLLDPQTGREIQRIETDGDECFALTFSPDGTQVASGTGGGNIHLWDLANNVFKTTMTGHMDWVKDCRFSRDSKRLFSASGKIDGTVKMWETETGREALSLRGFRAGVHSIALSPDDRRLYTATDDGSVRVFFFGSENTATVKAESR